jgi:hypothetical protein
VLGTKQVAHQRCSRQAGQRKNGDKNGCSNHLDPVVQYTLAHYTTMSSSGPSGRAKAQRVTFMNHRPDCHQR